MHAKKRLKTTTSLLGLSLLITATLTPVSAHSADTFVDRPKLVINNAPAPEELKKNLYIKPIRSRDIAPEEISGSAYYKPSETLVTRKVNALYSDLQKLQGNATSLSAQLANLQRENHNKSANYYAAVATINAQLQNGTTPGNPRLLNRFARAENSLENLGSTVNDMNQLSIEVSRIATEAAFLLETIRSAFLLSGAVEEDHVDLKRLEDEVNGTIVTIDRISSTLSDNVSRTTAFLSAERSNLRALSLAVTQGELYGSSLANRPFSEQLQSPNQEALTPRPLVKIRFDRNDVDYTQPVYMAVNEALERYPNAQFDLIAVHPAQGNAAAVAIESTRARRNAERVMRTLSEMGLDMSKVTMSNDTSDDARSSEVHIYIR